MWREVRERARDLAVAGARRARVLPARSYGLARALHALRFRLTHARRGRPVVVHQMGKVGSTSVVRSLEASALDGVVYHTHYLSEETLTQVERVFREAHRVTGRAIIAPHVVAGRHLRRRWRRWRRSRGARSRGARPWKLVSLVRDPVARNVSAFFNAFHLYFPEHGRRFPRDPSNVAELRELFLNGFEFENRLPLRWFDSEVRRVFGIDVYAAPFPHERAWATYGTEGAQLLVLRLEDLDRCAADALGEFLGLPGVRLASANVGERKAYDDAYRRFKATVRLPAAYLDRLYGSAYARHFYTADEIDAFRERWER